MKEYKMPHSVEDLEEIKKELEAGKHFEVEINGEYIPLFRFCVYNYNIQSYEVHKLMEVIEKYSVRHD